MTKALAVMVLCSAVFAAGWYGNRAYIKHYMDQLPDDPKHANAFTACLKERWEAGWR